LTEQALYFAMGALITLLAGILAMPMVSRRAWRLARMRASLSGRSAETSAAANTDSERAAHAVELARLNHRLAVAEENALKLRTAVGRQSVRDITLKAHTSDLERSMVEMRSEVDRMEAERADLKVAGAALQVALHDAFAQRDEALSRAAMTQVRVGELMAEASRDRAKIAILSARAEELERLLNSSRADQEKTTATEGEQANSPFLERSRSRSLEASVGAEGERPHLMNRRVGAARLRNDSRKPPPNRAAQSGPGRSMVLNENGARRDSAISQALGPDGGNGAKKSAPPSLDALQWESEGLRARICAAASQRDTADLAALRMSILRFGCEIRRLSLAQEAASHRTIAGTDA
jgi:hypothetical protein